MTAPLLRVEHLKKVYQTGKQDLVLFDDLSFELGKGEMLANGKSKVPRVPLAVLELK